jgi:hypothetical protein
VAPQTSYFTDAAMVRRVHREFVVGLAGPRTLLLQATHPVAFAASSPTPARLTSPAGRFEAGTPYAADDPRAA